MKKWMLRESLDVPGTWIVGEFEESIHGPTTTTKFNRILVWGIDKIAAQKLVDEHNQFVTDLKDQLDKANNHLSEYLYPPRRR